MSDVEEAKDYSTPLATPINEFSVALFQRLSKAAGPENVFVSPFSVSTALAMLLLGARERSADQLHQGLRFHLMKGDKEDVHKHFQRLILEQIAKDDSLMLANYVLIQKEAKGNQVLDKYRSDLQTSYASQVDDVDFAKDAVKILGTVNGWVKKNTKELIQSILTEPPPSSTRLILLNAVYFKGKWDKPFEKNLTQPMPFFNRGTDEEKQTDFLIHYNKKHGYSKGTVGGQQVQVLEMTYDGSSKSMIIVLPDKRDGLKEMIAADSFLTDVSKVDADLRQRKLDLFMPKFKFETEYDLNNDLSEMGISDIFTSSADLSAIAGRKDLLVSLVKHKAVVKVDEEGTEAAAVTAVMVMRCCMVMEPDEKIELRADHPFLFLIKDKRSNLTLFLGKVESF